MSETFESINVRFPQLSQVDISSQSPSSSLNDQTQHINANMPLQVRKCLSTSSFSIIGARHYQKTQGGDYEYERFLSTTTPSIANTISSSKQPLQQPVDGFLPSHVKRRSTTGSTSNTGLTMPLPPFRNDSVHIPKRKPVPRRQQIPEPIVQIVEEVEEVEQAFALQTKVLPHQSKIPSNETMQVLPETDPLYVQPLNLVSMNTRHTPSITSLNTPSLTMASTSRESSPRSSTFSIPKRKPVRSSSNKSPVQSINSSSTSLLLTGHDEPSVSIQHTPSGKLSEELSTINQNFQYFNEANKLYLFQHELRRMNVSAYNILTTFYPNAITYDSYFTVYMHFLEVIKELAQKLYKSDFVFHADTDENSVEKLELALWTIWDFCLCYQDKALDDQIIEQQIEFLRARCKSDQLQEVSKVWQYLHSALYPVKNIITNTTIAEIFGGEGNAEAQMEIMIDYICSAGLDHVLTLSSLAQSSDLSAHHEILDYLLQHNFLAVFNPDLSSNYSLYFQEPARKLYLRLQVEAQQELGDKVMSTQDSGWGASNMMEDELLFTS